MCKAIVAGRQILVKVSKNENALRTKTFSADTIIWLQGFCHHSQDAGCHTCSCKCHLFSYTVSSNREDIGTMPRYCEDSSLMVTDQYIWPQ